MSKFISILFLILFLMLSANYTLKADNEISDTINYTQKKNLIENNLEIIKNNLVYESDTFLDLAKLTLNLSKKINYKNGICNSYRYIGDIYKIRNINDSAIYYYKKGINLSYDNCNERISFYWNLSILHRITGNYSEALEMSLRAKELIESGKVDQYKYKVYNLLALSYQSLMEYDLALSYFEKTAEMALQEQDTAFSGVIYANIGRLLYDLEKYDESLEFFKKGTKIEKEYKLWGSLGNSYTVIANIFLKTEQLDSARFYLFKATDLHQKSNNKQGLTHTLLGVSQYYFKTQDYKNALFHLNITIRYAQSYNLKRILSDAHQLKAKIFAEQKKYEDAYKEFERFFDIYSTLYDVKKINQVKALEQRLNQQEKESEIVALELKKQKTINILLFIIIGLILLVASFISFYLFRMKQLRVLKQIIHSYIYILPE